MIPLPKHKPININSEKLKQVFEIFSTAVYINIIFILNGTLQPG